MKNCQAVPPPLTGEVAAVIPETTESLQSFATEHIRDIVLVQNMDGKILYINPAVLKITGWTQEACATYPSVLSKESFCYINEDMGKAWKSLSLILKGSTLSPE